MFYGPLFFVLMILLVYDIAVIYRFSSTSSNHSYRHSSEKALAGRLSASVVVASSPVFEYRGSK